MIASLWASPVTLAGRIYAELFRLFGWYEFLRKQDGVRIYQVSFRAPMKLLHLWSNWAGQTVGEVIVREAQRAARQET